jgi:hypothetical protein
VNEVWVVNASPVIVLAKVGHLQLLKELPGELLLPVPVAMEIQSGPGSDAARQALEGGWGVRVTAGRIPSELVEWGLGPEKPRSWAWPWNEPIARPCSMTPPLAPAREPSPFRSLARWESCCEPGNGESFLRLGTCSGHCVQPACTWMMKPYARPCGVSGRNGSNLPSAHDDQPPPSNPNGPIRC